MNFGDRRLYVGTGRFAALREAVSAAEGSETWPSGPTRQPLRRAIKTWSECVN
jgi:hypothetical protein